MPSLSYPRDRVSSALLALTRNYTEYRGYWLPNRFSNEGPVAEYWACRERAVMMDLSPLRKFEVTGPDAESLLQYALTRNVRKLAVGQVVYTAMCYEHGGMIDDGTLFRLGDNNFRWIGGDDYSGIWLREQAEKLGLKAWVRSSTDQLHNVAVQGPKSRDILREVIWTPPAQPALEELGWFRFTIGRIGGFDGAPVVVSRTGYTGELGYEIFCHPKDALTVFDAVWKAGEPHGLMPFGLQALDMVRIEAGLVFAGYEFCDQTDPFEAGIGFTVPLTSKNEDFIGREALVRRKEHPQRKLVGLEMEGDEAVGHGDCVHSRPRPGRRDHQRHPFADPEKDHRAGPGRCHAMASSARRSRSASSTASRSVCPAHCALPALRSGQDARTRVTEIATRLTMHGTIDTSLYDTRSSARPSASSIRANGRCQAQSRPSRVYARRACACVSSPTRRACRDARFCAAEEMGIVIAE